MLDRETMTALDYQYAIEWILEAQAGLQKLIEENNPQATKAERYLMAELTRLYVKTDNLQAKAGEENLKG